MKNEICKVYICDYQILQYNMFLSESALNYHTQCWHKIVNCNKSPCKSYKTYQHLMSWLDILRPFRNNHYFFYQMSVFFISKISKSDDNKSIHELFKFYYSMAVMFDMFSPTTRGINHQPMISMWLLKNQNKTKPILFCWFETILMITTDVFFQPCQMYSITIHKIEQTCYNRNKQKWCNCLYVSRALELKWF